MSDTQVTAILLIVIPIAMTVFFMLLQSTFAYPDILRQPTDYVLRKFHEGGSRLIVIWHGFTLMPVLFVPLVVMVHRVLAPDNGSLLAVATTIGVLSGVVQFLGLIRWPFLVPYLAKLYLDPSSSPTTREAIVVVFQAFHRYAGVAIGEHLGYLFTSIWTVLIALAMVRSPFFNPLLAWVGIIPAIGIFIGVFEEAGFKAAGAINAISFILWPIWLVLTGILLLL